MTTASTCCYCGVGCGVLIEHDGERILDVAGDPSHPANFGKLCSKGSTLHLTGDLDARALYPELRLGKGLARSRTDWDSALEHAASVFAETIREHGPDSVAFYVSGQLLTEDYYAFNKLARALVGTNNLDSNSRLCMSSAVVGYKRKPRSDVSAIGIKKVEYPDEVWRAIEEMNERENLRERASYYILARFIPGEVFHVDSLVNDGKIVFSGANQYGRPPMQVAHQGGAYISRTVARGSAAEKTLTQINKKLIKALGLERGATHAEFIKSDADGQFYFLEIAARVGGAYIAEVLEAASGVNLWREWARLEIADGNASSKVGPSRKEYAGIILSLAKQEEPDTSAYVDEEIVYRVKKRRHAGLIVRAKELDRVTALLDDYSHRFSDDFVAVAPPPERPE
jgi:hypothetical protein